ncbi:hypothetical protein GH808_11510 [Acetobacterium fimetarium]|uniref:BIG2 domain-containing protein n=1 Tax=Acetobacterium fimetarium TaxID=52691 RepID=A0ABR6WWQ6_9FIRM|nr:Ig-like domain-containing protein [Acetobacterium fimetarium]MBC3805057.1 hypothetical protein [Acetobacterium fimetarium]
MKRKCIGILTGIMLILTVCATSVFAEENPMATGLKSLLGSLTTRSVQECGVTYRTQVQDIGWETNWMTNGYTAGTQGRSQRLEGIQIKLTGAVPADARIIYRTQVQDQGWESEWSQNGDISGTVGRSLRLEAIQIKLVNMPGYSVRYRCHIQNLGWESEWSENGEIAGTVGKSLRLEGIQIMIVKNAGDLEKYNEVLSVAKSVDQEKYTPESWAYLQATLTGFAVASTSTQNEVDVATRAIQNAFNALVLKDNALYYSKAGTYGPATGMAELAQDVVIKADGVTLQNTHITGNLIISEEVGDGDVMLNNVTVDGNTFVRGGGVDSIHINGGSYSKITVQKTATGKVRIVATNVAGLDVEIAEGDVNDTVILEGSFDTVQVDAPGVIVSTSGTTVIKKMIVSEAAAGCKVVINTGACVDKLVVDAKMDIRGQGQIVKAEINADNVTYQKIPDAVEVDSHVTVPPVEVTVPVVLVTDMKIQSADDTTTIAVGSSLQMSVVITPSDATNKNVKWSLLNPDGVATITSTGLVYARKTGAVTVQAEALDGSEVSATRTIVINDPGVPTIFSNTNILYNAENQDFVLTLENDTFTQAAYVLTNWTSTMGETGLTIASIDRNSDTQVTVHTAGKAKAGTITIKAKSAALTRGLESNILTIDVPVIHVTSVAVAGANITADNGSAQLSASVSPTDATNKKIIWSITSGASCAKISEDGLLTALKDGDVVVRGTSADGSGVYSEVTIKVSNQFETTISANPTTIANGSKDPKLVITLTNDKFTARSLVENKDNWTVAGTTGLSIDTITRDSDTQVTILLKGTAQYGDFKLKTKETATVNAEVSNEVAVTVPPIPVDAIIISPYLELTAGESSKLTASVLPESASIKTLSWKSSENVVASVDQDGLITAHYEGLAFITAISYDGKKAATCAVKVTASNAQNQAIVDAEALKYQDAVTVPREVAENADVTATVAKLLDSKAAGTNIELSYSVLDDKDSTVTEDKYQYLKIDNGKVILKQQKITPGDATERILITFKKGDKIATHKVTVTIQTTTTLQATTLSKIAEGNNSLPAEAQANQAALVQDSGAPNNAYTFRAKAPLQSYLSADPNQGSGKWAGFVINTGLKTIEGLSVDTGSGKYYDFTTADKAEALTVGAGAGQFVFWMKTDVAAQRTLKIKNGSDIKTITIDVVDFAFESITKNTDTTKYVPDDGATTVSFANNIVTVGGTIPYQTTSIAGFKAGTNLFELKVKLTNVDKTKAAFKSVGSVTNTYDAKDQWMDGDDYFYYIGAASSLDQSITLTVDYDGNWETKNDQISCVIKIAAGTTILAPTQDQVLKVIEPTITSAKNTVTGKYEVTVDYKNPPATALEPNEKALLNGYYADAAIYIPAGVHGDFTITAFGSDKPVHLDGSQQTLYLSKILGLTMTEANLILNQSDGFTVNFSSTNVDSMNFKVQSVVRDNQTINAKIIPYGSLVEVFYPN